LFGPYEVSQVNLRTHDRASGYIKFKNAKVSWFLGINEELLASHKNHSEYVSHRILKIDDRNYDFSEGFESLHINSYKQILAGNGFTVKDTESSIKLAQDIRNMKLKNDIAYKHPLCSLPVTGHPFLGSS